MNETTAQQRIEAHLIGGPKDGERLVFAQLEQVIVVVTSLPLIADAALDHFGPSHREHREHVYQLALNYGKPSRTDDGAYRYCYQYDR